MSELPSGWVRAQLGQVATSQLGRMLSAGRETGEHPKPYLRNRDVQWGLINVNELPVMDFGPNDAARYLLYPGDVLVCEGGEVGRAAIWNGQLSECYYQKALHRVRTSSALLPRFLLYLLEYYARSRAFERYISGTTIAHLPQEDLRNLPIPIPPSAEQERIVLAIEEQLSRLDAGVSALERAHENLRRMRAAIFQAAVNSTLIETDLGIWETYRLADVAIIASGQTPRGLELAQSGPIPFYKVGDMNVATGQFMAASRGYVDMPTARRFGLHIRPAGTVIFPKRGGAIATNKKRILREPAAYDLNTMGLVPGTDIDPRFLYLWLSSIDLNRLADGSNVPQINHGDLADLELRIPSRTEQERIVAVADAALSLVDGLETALSHAETRSNRLRSSILAAAFSGNLVPQDPADESASALLQRIAAERAVSSGHKATQARKPRAPREQVTA